MRDRRQTLGRLGEELAAQHLQRQGYVILKRNYRCQYGEVDIIAQDGQRTAFVEVRTRTGSAFGTPEESVTLRKQERLATVARSYLEEKELGEIDWGIDVVAVEFRPDGVLQRIELIRNAVRETA